LFYHGYDRSYNNHDNHCDNRDRESDCLRNITIFYSQRKSDHGNNVCNKNRGIKRGNNHGIYHLGNAHEYNRI
jgi:hypothetical protein